MKRRWLTTVNTIGLFFKRQGKFKEADPFYRRALEGCERTLGRDHPDTLTSSVSNLGALLFQQGKLKEAEPFFRRALEGSKRTLGSEHPHTRTSARWLTLLLDKIQKAKVSISTKKNVDYLHS